METVKGPDSLEETLERMVDLYQLPLLRLCYPDFATYKAANPKQHKHLGFIFA